MKKLKGLTGQVLLFHYGAVGGLGGWDPYKKMEWLKADGRGSRAQSRHLGGEAGGSPQDPGQPACHRNEVRASEATGGLLSKQKACVDTLKS